MPLTVLLRRFMEIYLPMKRFFHNLIHPEYSAVTDVYVLMFLADTVDFIIIVFGFWAFGVSFTARFVHRVAFLRGHELQHCCVSLPETLSSRHHVVPLGGPGARTFPGHGSDPVRDHGGGPCPLPQKVRHGQGHFPGHPALRHPLLDVLHPARSHREVNGFIILFFFLHF